MPRKKEYLVRHSPPTSGSQALFHFDLARGGGQFLDLLLGNVNGHHAVFDPGRNFLALDVVGQQQALLELRIGAVALRRSASQLLSRNSLKMLGSQF